MQISPVSSFSQSSNRSKAKSTSKKSFSELNNNDDYSASLNRSNRTIAMVGSLCLSGAVGLLAYGIVASLTEGKVKPSIAGMGAGLTIAGLSWPRKK